MAIRMLDTGVIARHAGDDEWWITARAALNRNGGHSPMGRHGDYRRAVHTRPYSPRETLLDAAKALVKRYKDTGTFAAHPRHAKA